MRTRFPSLAHSPFYLLVLCPCGLRCLTAPSSLPHPSQFVCVCVESSPGLNLFFFNLLSFWWVGFAVNLTHLHLIQIWVGSCAHGRTDTAWCFCSALSALHFTSLCYLVFYLFLWPQKTKKNTKKMCRIKRKRDDFEFGISRKMCQISDTSMIKSGQVYL